MSYELSLRALHLCLMRRMLRSQGQTIYLQQITLFMSPTLPTHDELDTPVGTTLERYIMRKQAEFPYATGELSQLLRDLALAGKIVSVEARHAALIRDLVTYNSFVASDIVNTFTQTAGQAPGTGTSASTGAGNPGPGQERSKRPPTVLASVNNFLANGSKLSANSFM